MHKIKNIMLIGVTFILYTSCGYSQVYKILAKRDAQRAVKKIKYRYEFFSKKPKKPFNQAEEYDRQYNKLVKLYKSYEDNLEGLKKELKDYPVATLFGGINYTMTLDEMKEKVRKTFIKMKEKGLIISNDEFEKIKKNYWKSRGDLSRIWGREYLMRKINKSKELQKKYDVPNYVIVADDPNHIEVKIDFSNDLFPMVQWLENASLHFVTIDGRPAAFEPKVRSDLKVTGFHDFSGPDNVIYGSPMNDKTGTNKFYVVDTELKSFKSGVEYKELENELHYTWKRFLHFNNDINHYIYDIDLSIKK